MKVKQFKKKTKIKLLFMKIKKKIIKILKNKQKKEKKNQKLI
jgi:hypothetical protein